MRAFDIHAGRRESGPVGTICWSEQRAERRHMDSLLPNDIHRWTLACVLRALASLSFSAAVCSARQVPAPTPAPEQPAGTPPAAASASAPAKAAPAVLRPDLAKWEPRYHALDEIAARVDELVQAGLAQPLSLPKSRGGLRTPALVLGGDGPVPLAERPTIFLLGGLDGSSLSGSEAVLAIVTQLLQDRATLPANVAFVAVPWAAPDGLSDVLAGSPSDGRDRLPLDDDGDLQIDEDGPDDVDKDGLVLDMIVEDPTGTWTRAADARFLARARTGDRPRYRLSREGRDDDHDGRYNEDSVGGVSLDLSFPIGWDASAAGSAASASQPSAPLPLDDPLTRALADAILARSSLAVLVFQGNHGQIAAPGGRAGVIPVVAADQHVFDDVARLFAAATGRPVGPARALREVRGVERGGAAIDWVHAVPGAIALEVAAWGPSVDHPTESKDVGLADARFDKDDARASLVETSAPTITPLDREWAHWLDNTRGGIGFVDWHPVDLGDGTKASVGGWEPYSRANPPATSLAAAEAGLAPFVERLAAAAPMLEVRVLEARRDGDVVTLRWRVENTGRLPTGLSTSTRGRPENATRAEMTLPSEARLMWGDTKAVIGDLAAGATSRELVTVVLAPAGSVLTLRAVSPWTATSTREVRP